MPTSKISKNLFSIKQSVKIKKHFCKCCLQCFSSEIISVKHKEACLKINGKQTIKLRSGPIMQ